MTETFPQMVAAEVERAMRLHRAVLSHDEALSVLEEEAHEARMEVYKNSRVRKDEDLRDELVQVASMARKWADNLGLARPGQFSQWEDAALADARRSLAKAASDHESLTRMERWLVRLRRAVLGTGSHTEAPAGGSPDGPCPIKAADLQWALSGLAAACRRWAEDRGLCAAPDAPSPSQAA
jgi:hypothetical protein